MNLLKPIIILSASLLILAGCEKNTGKPDNTNYTYYEVGFKSTTADWRDTAFVVRTADNILIQQIEAQLALPVAQRKLVTGALVAGSGGYNRNATHEFKWHLKETDWKLADVTIEIYDGRPYTDIDVDYDYWMGTVKRYGSWGSYIRKKLADHP
jgi:hypothetical protein